MSREHLDARAAEDSFRQLAENLDAAFYLTNLDNSEIYYLSRAFEAIWGRPAADVVANPALWHESIHPDDRSAAVEGWQLAARGPVTRQYRIRRSDGSTRWIRVRSFPVTDGKGVAHRIAGIAEDVTERIETQEKLVRLNRVHAVLSGIASLIARSPSKQELFSEACRIAVEAGKLRMAWLGLFDRVALVVKPVASHGIEDGFIQLMPLALDNLDRHAPGMVRSVLRTKSPVVFHDIEHDSGFQLRSEALQRGYRSCALLPLLIGGEVRGVLGFFAGEANFFDDEELRLLRSLAGDISFALDHHEKSETLRYLAYYDALTGLSNRSLFLERLRQALQGPSGSGRSLALIVCDLERFRSINESMGREAGDQLLTLFAARLQQCVLDPQQLARLPGDQFAIVLPDVKSELDAAHVLGELSRVCFGEPFVIGDVELRTSARAGVALYPSSGTEPEVLLRNAEAALQRCKRRGASYLFFEEEMSRRVADNLDLENRLRRAIEREEFVLHYQPRVDLRSGRLTGVEALIRWNVGRDLVLPSTFIPLLEETNLILQVGTWALRQAAHDHAALVRTHGLRAPRIAVNISAVQLRQRDFVSRVKEALGAGVSPTGLDAEVTESQVMDDLLGSVEKLNALREIGMDVALDDFGTGYSSLAYLAKLPVTSLKIDRSFVITMQRDATSMTLVRTMVSLGHALGLKVVAEGVDDEAQLVSLRELRCDEIQGYLVSTPLSLAELGELILKQA